ncbi:MAG: hypothetical protein FWF55_00560, partial [Treponema sp.]|nr:hypothetical protein [Treponema sp.]
MRGLTRPLCVLLFAISAAGLQAQDDLNGRPLRTQRVDTPPERSTRTGERVVEQMQHGVGQEKASVTLKVEGPPPLPPSVPSSSLLP